MCVIPVNKKNAFSLSIRGEDRTIAKSQNKTIYLYVNLFFLINQHSNNFFSFSHIIDYILIDFFLK